MTQEDDELVGKVRRQRSLMPLVPETACGEHGFTLMEMVVAVLIVSIMTGILVPSLIGAGKRAQTEACEANQRTIRAALSEYYLEYNAYPTGDSATQLQTLVTAHLLQAVPVEPDGGTYVVNDTDPNNVVVSCSVHGQLGN